MDETTPSPQKHRRRPRYKGTHPRRFEEKYKELDPNKHPELIHKIIESGKTPAGTHRPIMVCEILNILSPKTGEIAVDATLGYGGHASQIIPQLLPGGKYVGIDADPLELPKTEARLRSNISMPEESFITCHNNFAALPKILSHLGIIGVDIVLADLGCSSMQFDNPDRGFSFKLEGSLDLRMNPQKGIPASEWLSTVDTQKLANILKENSDEPHAELIAESILKAHSHTPIQTTHQLTQVIHASLIRTQSEKEKNDAVRRVFQAIRIEMNAEFQVLESFLRALPYCLNPGARIAILTFHSGEDRRVKHALQDGLRNGLYSEVAREVLRPSAEEVHSNPRSSSAKLRWAIKK